MTSPAPPYAPADLLSIRESFGLNIPKFAALLSQPGAEIHRNTWRKWENGEQAMPAAAQCLVAAVLHMRERGALEGWAERRHPVKSID